MLWRVDLTGEKRGTRETWGRGFTTHTKLQSKIVDRKDLEDKGDKGNKGDKGKESTTHIPQ
ncbi:MAG TPA: hypothetical protein DCL61_00715, partial [Cyanobacteria bacterium UBA12227]|nr:hypothetical protein [Cyanobacteria bacterium UBA12227]